MQDIAVAVIPARGGSKRIPRKNIKLFRGRPLISYCIDAALESQLFERVVVSTDDVEIADVSLACGAEVPFLRGKDLSDDHTMTVPVIADAIRKLGLPNDAIVCCIYPTAALLLPSDLRKGLKVFREHPTANYACAVTEYGYPIQRALVRNSEGIYRMVHPEYLETRSQDLQITYHDVGMFYFAFAETWKSNHSMLSNVVGINIENWKAQDLDTDSDWSRLEIIREVLDQQGSRL